MERKRTKINGEEESPIILSVMVVPVYELLIDYHTPAQDHKSRI